MDTHPTIMMDEIFDAFFHAIYEFVPDVVVRIIVLLTGVVTAIIGVGMIGVGESTRIGGILTAIGVSLVVGTLALQYRQPPC